MVVFGICSCSLPHTSLTSPDGKTVVEFSTNNRGEMFYSVKYNDSTVIAPSRMGLECRGEAGFAEGFKVKGVQFADTSYIWHQPWGKSKEVGCNYRQMLIKLENGGKEKLNICFRVFNSGLGFRYECISEGKDSLVVTDELTQFNIAQKGTAWHTPANFDTYELGYIKEPISEVESANTPITCKTVNGTYLSLHEAALTNFPDMTVRKDKEGILTADLAPYPDGTKAKFAADRFITPWRTIQLGESAAELINSQLIINLNEPCKIKGDLSWCKPMKYIGIWWGMHLGIDSWAMDERHGATTENAKRYIDFAAAHNIQGVVFEGWNKGWETWGGNQTFDFTAPYDDFDVEEIARYAKEKNIAIIGHHETGGNIYNYEKQLDKAYQWSASLGMHYMKTGYAGGIPDGLNHHGQVMVNHYRKVVETAAKYQTNLDVHEPIKPTGIRRTYPNMMTREGARGMEWNAWSEGNSPTHTMTLPFTRLLAGPMDYTPGTFDILFEKTKHSPRRKKWNDLDKGNSRVHTTLARQIANWVILYSPLQMASDRIESYENHPAFKFFEDFDADCDWSKAIDGEIGEYIVVVRRAKNKFFLGAGTNEESRELTIPLNFLPKEKEYTATIYADAADADYETNPEAYEIRTVEVTSNGNLTIKMSRGGGQAVVFVEKEK